MRRDCRYSISITHTLQCTSACRNNCLKKASWIACRITRLWNCHRNQSRYSSNMAICAPLYGTLPYVYNDYKCFGGPYLCVMERFLPALSCRVQMRHQRHLGDESLFCPATNQGCQERHSHSRNTFCLRLFRRKKNISQKLSPIFYIFIVVKNLLKLEGQFTPK